MLRTIARNAAMITLLAAPQALARVELVLSYDGKELEGGEVCFFQTGTPATDTHPGTYWFFSNDVRCFSTNALLDLPAGTFHYFVRHKDGYINPYKSSLVTEQPASTDTDKQLIETVVPGTLVDLTNLRAGLAPSEWLAFITADSDAGAGTVFPVPDGAQQFMLPLDWPMLPIVIANRLPVRVGSPFTIKAGEPARIAIDPPRAGTGDVVSWIDLAQTAARNLQPMQVTLTNGRREWDPVFRVKHARLAYAALQVFRNVPAGRARIALSGRTWLEDDVPVDVLEGRLTMAPRALRTRPGGAVSAAYDLGASAVPLAAAIAKTCEPAEAQDTPVTFTLYRCTKESSDVEGCTLVQKSTAQPAEFVSLTIGNYIVEAEHPGLGITRKPVFLEPGDDTTLTIEPLAFPVFGTVTQAGKPVRVTLTFAAGSGFEKTTATDERGYYETILAGDPKASSVELRACDDSFEFRSIPELPLSRNTAYDIRIPGAAIQATVVDARTREPLAGAVTIVRIFSADGQRRIDAKRVVADEHGVAAFRAILDERFVEVCARHAGYRPRCMAKFKIGRNAQKDVVVDLSSEGMARGRLQPGGVFEDASLFWIDAAGELTETVRVEPDGAFYSEKDHSRDAYVVLVSTNQPLFVIDRWTLASTGELILSAPLNARVRSFTVHMSPRDPFELRFVAIRIGGRLVHPNAFDFHSMNRRVDPTVKRTIPLLVKDIAATGPIRVILGPAREEIPPGPFPSNLFAAPQFARLLRERLVPEHVDSVAFE